MAVSLEVLEERIGALMADNSELKRLIADQERRHGEALARVEERWAKQHDEFKKDVGGTIADLKSTLRNYGRIGVGLLTSARVALLVIIVQQMGGKTP